MSRRGKRRRLAKNVYADQSGISGIVRVRGHLEELRFPLTSAVPAIQREIAKRRLELEDSLPAPAQAGTLGAVVSAYLARLPDDRQTDRSALLQPWVDAIGSRPFVALTRSELQGVTNAWRQAGLSASRCNKRISALRQAWDAIAPDSALPHPITKIARYSEPRPVERDVELRLVSRILDALEDETTSGKPSKSKARLRVLAWTGQPPARLMAVQPQHVKWDADPPLLYVAPRRKGAGSSDAWLPLLPEAVEALRTFFAVKATGRFQVRIAARALRRAVFVVQAALRQDGNEATAARLSTVTVYTLRHSFLKALAEQTDDIYAVAEYAGHANLQTTRRYMKGAAHKRMAQGIAALSSTVPRSVSTTDRRKSE